MESIDLQNLPVLFSSNRLTAGHISRFTDFSEEQCQRLLNLLQKLGKDQKLQTQTANLIPELLPILQASANPEAALVNLERFVQQSETPRPLFELLGEQPRLLEMLITLFSGSQYLTDILIRHPDYLSQISERKTLSQPRGREQFRTAAIEAMEAGSDIPARLDALRRFQRQELLRIGTADLLRLLDLQTVTVQLSHLADALIAAALQTAGDYLARNISGFAVLALGKLGGRELNYSSDIDLFFLAASRNKALTRLGQRLIEALTRPTAEGFLYRVDMRLRPWGDSGALVPALPEAIQYYHQHARPWEKQAMLKARFIAGDEKIAAEFLETVREEIFFLEGDTVREEIRAMKKKIEAGLKRRGRAWGEVKSGKGSIRDVEFITQYLQITHGARNPEVRSRNTLDGLARLAAAGLLPGDHYRILSEGYIFLRSVEHYLQMMHDRQTHSLPQDAREQRYLARRLGFEGQTAGKRLLLRYQQHSEAIRKLYRSYISSRSRQVAAPETASPPPETTSSHQMRMGTLYSEVFSAVEIEIHEALISRLSAANLAEMEAHPLDGQRWQITIAAYDYLGVLSIICGLLFVYGFDIEDGLIFTYRKGDRQPSSGGPRGRRKALRRTTRAAGNRLPSRKLVDVFTVRPIAEQVDSEAWQQYRQELRELMSMLKRKEQSEALGQLAKRVAGALRNYRAPLEKLLPVDIEIDNSAAENCTVLRIDAPDTLGFLYEFSNALALQGIYIFRVMIRSLTRRVHDTLLVTDIHGNKITDPLRQRQLKAAAVLVKHFTHLLPHSPNPESALLHFREFIGQLFLQPDWHEEFASLERPEVLNALARLLGVSDFLWNDFLRMQHANLFPVLKDLSALESQRSKPELKRELDHLLRKEENEETRCQALNAFKDREMFRIDMRFILGFVDDFDTFSRELSDLAEVIVETATADCHAALVEKHGAPCRKDGQLSRYAVCALGKLGGREIGFASDIELMFIYDDDGHCSGEANISTAEFYDNLVQAVRSTIKAKREGIFEIDLRLRPYGRAGRDAVLLPAFRDYFVPGGPAWDYERQALTRLRPIAGDEQFAREVIAARDECLYGRSWLDVTTMRAMRERQLRELVSGGTINAKFSSGGLVDLEYMVQGLQILHGKEHEALRQANTAAVLLQLVQAGIITESHYRQLEAARKFLRALIEGLRMVRGHSKDLTVPPPDTEEFDFLARRLGYAENPAQLYQDLLDTTSVVRETARYYLK